MKLKSMVSLAVAALLACPAMVNANDIFVSFSAFGDGDAISNTNAEFDALGSGTAYIWVADTFQIDTGAFLDIFNSNTGVIELTGAEVFNPGVFVGATQVDTRFQPDGGTGISTGGQGISAGLIDEVFGFSVNEGTGILPSQTTGSTFEDAGHDPLSNAFLFASVDFNIVGDGNAEISLGIGDGLIVDGGVELTPRFSAATISVATDAIPEPTSAALLAVGMVALVSRRKR